MKKPLVLITHRFDDTLKAKLPQIQDADVRFVADLFGDDKLLSQATALIIRSSLKVDKDFLNKCSNLKFIVSATAGFDHLDLQATAENSVQCYHVPESQSLAAVEHTLALILTSQRKWTLARRQLEKGDWQRSLLLGRQLQGQSLGIIGVGRVGTLLAEKAKALGLKVYGYDPYLPENPQGLTMLGFEELMRTCDIVSLHVPQTKETRHMIKAETLGWMNTEATLINVARGDVVNEADLIQHLVENPSFFAGLDVFAKEPLVTKSHLLDLPNVVLTPHVGASTQEALRQSSELSLKKVLGLLAGQTGLSGALPPQAPWYQA